MSVQTWIAPWCAVVIIYLIASAASAEESQTESAAQHVPPDPPQQVMDDMSYVEMASMMQMDDTHRFGKVMLDRLEWRNPGEGAWDAQGWYGGDYNKLWLKTEGERGNGITRDARAELLVDRVVARWWSAQAGIRRDFGQGPARTWLGVGLQGLAPYWLDVEATLYAGEHGRTAARLKADYDLLLTQRLVLQPYAEANLYGKADRQRLIGSGLSDLELSLRLRYEIRRELAPYLGMVWSRRFGGTAALVRAAGESSADVRFVAGLRIWF
ncbi:MAG: putative copper resistance protein [Gammaproteobacteria bacterium]|nr:putative copper resistance protein [Gammaproteobacteria bacterium]